MLNKYDILLLLGIFLGIIKGYLLRIIQENKK